MKRTILIGLLLTATAFASSTPPVVKRYAVVTTEAELRAAALTASTQPTFTIMVKGRIELTKPLDIFGERIGMIGTDSQAEIVWAQKFGCGDWQSAPFNCISFNAPIVNIDNIRFRAMERGGIKWQCDPEKARLWSVTRCGFYNIAMIPCLPKGVRATSDNAPYGAALSAHAMYKAAIFISGCTFDHCNLSALYWAHTFYLSAENLVIVSCSFLNCGDTFSLGQGRKPVTGEPFRTNAIVAGNYIISQGADGKVPDPDGVLRSPTIYSSFGPIDAVTLTGNTYYGTFEYPFGGQPFSSGLNVVGCNNWRYATILSKDGSGRIIAGADTKAAAYFTVDEWKQLEATSIWPSP